MSWLSIINEVDNLGELVRKKTELSEKNFTNLIDLARQQKPLKIRMDILDSLENIWSERNKYANKSKDITSDNEDIFLAYINEIQNKLNTL